MSESLVCVLSKAIPCRDHAAVRVGFPFQATWPVGTQSLRYQLHHELRKCRASRYRMNVLIGPLSFWHCSEVDVEEGRKRMDFGWTPQFFVAMTSDRADHMCHGAMGPRHNPNGKCMPKTGQRTSATQLCIPYHFLTAMLKSSGHPKIAYMPYVITKYVF